MQLRKIQPISIIKSNSNEIRLQNRKIRRKGAADTYYELLS